MFLTTSHIPQLLPKDTYCRQDQLDNEINQLFLPAWHCVGGTRQLHREGDFFTRTLFGRPLLVCLMEGQPRAFLNSCAHRSSLLTSKPHGCNPTLRCQYHGWEYDADGGTRKIPDAPNFRLLSRDMAALKRCRIGVCGQLIFVSLADDGPTLADFLGSNWSVTEALFPPSSIHFSENMTVDVNWKLAVENGLESYHINCVHQKTLGSYPAENDCRHELADHYTLFEAPGSPPSLIRSVMEFLHRRIGIEPTRHYRMLHTYPNLFYAWDDSIGSIQTFFPLTPNRVEVQMFSFVRHGTPSAEPWNLFLKILGPLGSLFWRQLVKEDVRILPAVQLGAEAADMPIGGLLSRREERCAHFQAYVARETNVPPLHELPTFPPADAGSQSAAS